MGVFHCHVWLREGTGNPKIVFLLNGMGWYESELETLETQFYTEVGSKNIRHYPSSVDTFDDDPQ